MDATNAIYDLDYGTDDDPGPRRYARGAVIEQIAEGLLQIRRPSLLTEKCIGPLDERWFRNGRTDPIDFFTPDTPQEFWDAKSAVMRIKGPQVHQLNLLLEMADYGSMAGFITLENRIDLVDSLAEFTNFTQPLHGYVYENFETMADEGPSERVDSNV